MKNQYVGDIHDYVKYGLLRQLTGLGEVTTSICWMLTEDNDRQDGRNVKYLGEIDKWGNFDPDVFKSLRRQVYELNHRAVKDVEEGQLLPNSRFFTDILTDDASQRKSYFTNLLKFTKGSNLVFFDPDNGLDVKSVPYGEKNSHKYVYQEELKRFFSTGHSLLVYQHFPRQPRLQYINKLMNRLLDVTDHGMMYCLWTRRVAFFLLPQMDDLPFFREKVGDAMKVWQSVLECTEYSCEGRSTAFAL